MFFSTVELHNLPELRKDETITSKHIHGICQVFAGKLLTPEEADAELRRLRLRKGRGNRSRRGGLSEEQMKAVLKFYVKRVGLA